MFFVLWKKKKGVDFVFNAKTPSIGGRKRPARKSNEHPRQFIFQVIEIHSMDIQRIISLPFLLKFPTLYRWNMMKNVYKHTVISDDGRCYISSAAAKLLFFAYTTK